MKPEDIATEVFFFPAAQVAETEGSFTNTQRMLQWHFKAAEPPGDCRSDLWFTHQLALRLKKLYAESDLPRDQGFKNLIWDFDPDRERGRRPASRVRSARRASRTRTRCCGRSMAIVTGHPEQHLDGLRRAEGRRLHHLRLVDLLRRVPRARPEPRGQQGARPAGRARRASATGAGPGRPTGGCSTTAPRPISRAGPGASARSWVWWDGKRMDRLRHARFRQDQGADAPGNPKAIGLDALSGTEPFIMIPDGEGWLFNPSGLLDGPLPTHYEPAESPVRNPLYRQQSSPVLKYWKRDDNPLAAVADPRFPYVITTYRLTEHYLSGVMSRWNPWLAELMPELFIELSPELASEKGHQEHRLGADQHAAGADPGQGAGHPPDAAVPAG